MEETNGRSGHLLYGMSVGFWVSNGDISPDPWGWGA